MASKHISVTDYTSRRGRDSGQQMADELGTVPFRWRNLLHWQNVHAEHQFEAQELQRSIRNWLRVIALLLAMLVILELGVHW